MSIWINKKNEKTIHSTGKHWVNNACVSAPACREREIERKKGDGGWYVHSFKNLTCDRVSLTVPLWLFPLCFVLHLVCPRKAISSSRNKSIASRGMLLSASMKIRLSISRLYVLRRMDWDGSYFLLKQLISYNHISARLEHIYPEKQQNNSKKDNGSKQMEGMMQVDEMLDKIGIVHWISLSNTPILWITLRSISTICQFRNGNILLF